MKFLWFETKSEKGANKSPEGIKDDSIKEIKIQNVGFSQI